MNQNLDAISKGHEDTSSFQLFYWGDYISSQSVSTSKRHTTVRGPEIYNRGNDTTTCPVTQNNQARDPKARPMSD